MEGSLEVTPFHSIVRSFWLVIVTITTVGFGDAVPTTKMGNFIGTLTILSGIVVLAMPVGVIGSNFSTEYDRTLQEKSRRKKLKDHHKSLAEVEKEQDMAAQEAAGSDPRPRPRELPGDLQSR